MEFHTKCAFLTQNHLALLLDQNHKFLVYCLQTGANFPVSSLNGWFLNHVGVWGPMPSGKPGLLPHSPQVFVYLTENLLTFPCFLSNGTGLHLRIFPTSDNDYHYPQNCLSFWLCLRALTGNGSDISYKIVLLSRFLNVDRLFCTLGSFYLSLSPPFALNSKYTYSSFVFLDWTFITKLPAPLPIGPSTI